MSVEFLRQLPLLSGLSDEDLARLYQLAVPIELSQGEVLMKEGTQGDSLYVVLEGEFEITKRSGEREIAIAVRGAGEVMGEMGLLSEEPRSATVTAMGPARLLRLDQEDFQSVLRSSSEAAMAILHTVTSRLRNTESMLRHHEKLSSLGTMAAGLAHEINNPAGAVQRAAEQQAEVIRELARAGEGLAVLGISATEREQLVNLWQELESATGETLSSLDRSDRQEELGRWLQRAEVEDGWRYVGPLVEAGWTRERLGELEGTFRGEKLHAVVRWLAQSSEALALTREVSGASTQILSIVQSVKDYAYLDQAPEQVVDIERGLEDTLVMLQNRLGEQIQIKREFAAELPRVEGFGSELTQVWTNLVENAIDAMEGEGTLTLKTRRSESEVEVVICDDGPGIPAEVRDRIFDPFFTTKPPGFGTGLGLHMVYNIVVQRHKGSIAAESEPGRTCFTVTLPAAG